LTNLRIFKSLQHLFLVAVFGVISVNCQAGDWAAEWKNDCQIDVGYVAIHQSKPRMRIFIFDKNGAVFRPETYAKKYSDIKWIFFRNHNTINVILKGYLFNKTERISVNPECAISLKNFLMSNDVGGLIKEE
jgi:hypothetical protein